MPYRSLSLIVTRLSLVSLLSASPANGQQDISFTRDVRSILSNACFHCHGPDGNTREAELRLDQRAGLFEDRGGYAAVKPHDPANSEIIRRVLSDDPDEMMPPPSANKPLSKEQKKILSDWILQGADWQQHWAFTRPKKKSPPKTADTQWPQNEIDQFILARIEAAGLKPSPVADPHALVRRIYLDLIGLPPTPQEADHWVAKIRPRAGRIDQSGWQQLIDHLLQSPHYGERWARRWLDLARYADTNGYEKDRERSIWPYRDWVVKAINSAMPFDRFTVEQLAGDMLPNASIDQRIATGFHRNTMLNEEGGIDPLEFRFHAMTDRVATTGTTWLGLTLGCCQCHTHKYDPITHDEYYQVMAYLNNADEPQLELPDTALEQRWKTNKAKATQLLKELPSKWPVSNNTIVAAKNTSIRADGSQKLTTRADGFTIVTGDNTPTATYVAEMKVDTLNFDQLRLSLTASGKRNGPGRTPHGNCVVSELIVEAVNSSQPAGVVDIPIASATGTVEQTGFELVKAFDKDESTGWGLSGPNGVTKTAEATFTLSAAALAAVPTATDTLRVTLKQLHGNLHTIGGLRLQMLKSLPPSEREAARTTAIAAAYSAWRKAELPNAVVWTHLKPLSATSNLPILTIQDDASIFASGDTAKRDDYEITLAASDRPVTSLRLEALPDARLPEGGPGTTYYEGTRGDFYLTEITTNSATDHQRFQISNATHTFAKNRFGSNPAGAELAIDGDIQTGWAVHGRQGERHVAVFNFAQPIPAGTPLKIHMSFGRHFASSLGRFRFSATDAATKPSARPYGSDVVDSLQNSDVLPGPESPAWHAFLMTAPELLKQTEAIKKLLAKPAATSTLVLTERPAQHPRPTFRHHRGEYLQPKNRVSALLPEALIGSTASSPKNRLEFARWLVAPENPLTSRVVANRQWAAFFGTGIVKTLDDFGLQGEAPTHPELLDWLAVTLQTQDRWSIRELHRRIVSSATYQQSSVHNTAAAKVDPDNRLLSYSPRYRLEAEIVRDQLLVAAGVLNPKIGGVPVRPPQPTGVTEVAYGNAKWKTSSGTDRYRRSLYTFSKRTAPFAMFSTFDAPSGEACIARRNRSNSPLQALTLLNDVMLMDLAAKAGSLAAKRSQKSDRQQTASNLFRSVLVRPPTPEELDMLLAFLEIQQARFETDPSEIQGLSGLENAASPQARIRRAAWTSLARALFSLDEVLSRS